MRWCPFHTSENSHKYYSSRHSRAQHKICHHRSNEGRLRREVLLHLLLEMRGRGRALRRLRGRERLFLLLQRASPFSHAFASGAEGSRVGRFDGPATTSATAKFRPPRTDREWRPHRRARLSFGLQQDVPSLMLLLLVYDVCMCDPGQGRRV